MRKRLLLFVSLLLTLTASAQDTSGQRQKLGGTPGDERIIREVHHELVMLPYYTVFDNLAYKVENGTVTLLGQVSRPSLKSDAENSIKKIEGVEKVVNDIQVLPTSPSDDRIRRAAYRTIYSHPMLSKYAWGAVPPIHIIVDHGRITLEGVVDNDNDKNVAGIQAKSVPGAFGVTNNLRVENQKQGD